MAIHNRHAGHRERNLKIAFTLTCTIYSGNGLLIEHRIWGRSIKHFNHFDRFNRSDPVLSYVGWAVAMETAIPNTVSLVAVELQACIMKQK